MYYYYYDDAEEEDDDDDDRETTMIMMTMTYDDRDEHDNNDDDGAQDQDSNRFSPNICWFIQPAQQANTMSCNEVEPTTKKVCAAR